MSAAWLPLVLALLGAAPSSQLLPISGRLTTVEGRPVLAAYDVTFELLESRTATAALWTETQSVAFEGGFFTAYLGSVTPLPAELLREHPDLHLRITVDGDAMEPFALGAVPYAATARLAADARTLDGHTREDLFDSLAPVARSGAFSDLRDLPAGLADGDDDLLASLACAPGQIVRRVGGSFACTADVDTLGELQCQDGQLPQWAGTGWTCGAYSAAAPLLLTGNVLTLANAGVLAQHVAPGQLTDGHVAATAAIAPSKIAGTAATLTGSQAFDGTTLVVDAAANRVGVGVAAPAATLDVAGGIRAASVEASGTIQATALQVTPRTVVRFLSPADFAEGGPLPMRVVQEGIVAPEVNNTSGSSTVAATFVLGPGEELRKISCISFDNQTAYDSQLSLTLTRRPLRSSPGVTLASQSLPPSSGASATARTLDVAFPVGAVAGAAADVFVLKIVYDRIWTGATSTAGVLGLAGCELEILTAAP